MNDGPKQRISVNFYRKYSDCWYSGQPTRHHSKFAYFRAVKVPNGLHRVQYHLTRSINQNLCTRTHSLHFWLQSQIHLQDQQKHTQSIYRANYFKFNSRIQSLKLLAKTVLYECVSEYFRRIKLTMESTKPTVWMCLRARNIKSLCILCVSILSYFNWNVLMSHEHEQAPSTLKWMCVHIQHCILCYRECLPWNEIHWQIPNASSSRIYGIQSYVESFTRLLKFG